MDRILPPAPKKRPIVITIICILGFVSAVLIWGIILIKFDTFTRAFQKIGNWYFPYIVFSAIVGLLCFANMWHMRKWAVYTYTLLGAINLVVLFLTNASFIGVIMSIVYIVVPWLYIKQMH